LGFDKKKKIERKENIIIKKNIFQNLKASQNAPKFNLSVRNFSERREKRR